MLLTVEAALVPTVLVETLSDWARAEEAAKRQKKATKDFIFDSQLGFTPV